MTSRVRAFAASPAQIRAAAAVAWRQHVRLVHATTAKPARAPQEQETPLSAAELEFGIERGLIRAPLQGRPCT